MDWRSQLHAELALGVGEDRLTEPERAAIAKGRSFEALFNGSTNVRPLPWRLPGAKCDIAYVDGDPSPWCRCMLTMPASMEAVLEGIWEIDGAFMHYHERVAYKVLDRPSVHGVLWSFKVRVVPMLPPFEWTLSGTWVASTAAGGEKEYTVVFLPASTAHTWNSKSSSARVPTASTGRSDSALYRCCRRSSRSCQVHGLS